MLIEPGSYTIAGKDVMILSDRDLCNTIYEIMGNDIGKAIKNLIEVDYKELKKIERSNNTDYDHLCEELNEMRYSMEEVEHDIKNLESNIKSKRTNKDKALKSIYSIKEVTGRYV